MPFNVDAALRAGYTEAQIADFLAGEARFNVRAARQAGYRDSDIIKELAPKASGTINPERKAYDFENQTGVSRSAMGADRPLNQAEREGAAQRAAWDESNPAQRNAKISQGRTILPADSYGERQYLKGRQALAGIGSGIARVAAAALPEGDASRAITDKADRVDAYVDASVGGETLFDQVKDPSSAAAWAADELPSSLLTMPMLLHPLGQSTLATGLTGNIAQDRAQANGTTTADMGDVLVAAPFGIGSALLDKYGLDRVVKATGNSVFARTAKAMLGEGATETAQSLLEYGGGTVGTTAGFDPATAGSQMLQGGILGAIGGGVVHGGIEGLNAATRTSFPTAYDNSVSAAAINAYTPPQGNQAAVEPSTLRPIAPGIRSTAIEAAARPTAGDVASPIPTDLIVEGKADLADATAKGSADSVLQAAGLPATGTRVTVTLPGQPPKSGTISDAFNTDAGELGTASGVAINMDDGSVFTEHFDTLAEAGVRIASLDGTMSDDEWEAELNAPTKASFGAKPGEGYEPALDDEGNQIGWINTAKFAQAEADRAKSEQESTANRRGQAQAAADFRSANRKRFREWFDQSSAGDEIVDAAGNRYRVVATNSKHFGAVKKLVAINPDGTVDEEFFTDISVNSRRDSGFSDGVTFDSDNFGQNPSTRGQELAERLGADLFNPTAEADALDAALVGRSGISGIGRPGTAGAKEPEEDRAGRSATPSDDGVAIVRSIFGDKARVTSGYRGPDHPLSRKNPNSWHARSRAAVDMAPIPGMTFEQAKAQIEAQGYTLIEALNEVGKGQTAHATGDHWHFVIGGSGGSSVNTAQNAASAAQDAQTDADQPEGRSYLDEAMARSYEETVGDPIDGEWSKFADTSGTLGVPRDDMPQIKAEHRGAMVNFLNARGIAHEEQSVPASDLKPTQAEFSNAKVQQAREYKGGDRAILTSSDGYVLDGHHQWMAALSKGENVRTIRLDAPIAELLKTVPEFPSATDAQGSTDTKPVEIPERPADPLSAAERAEFDRLKNENANGELDEDDMERFLGLAGKAGNAQRADDSTGAAAPAATVEDFTDKSVIVRGLDNSDASKAIVASALPAKGLPLWNAKAQGWVVSKKHADKLREVLGGVPGREQRGDAAKPVDRDLVAQSLAEALGHTRSDFHGRVADAILGKDFWALREYLAPHNAKSRKVFSDVTGVKLPATKAGTINTLREWAGVDPAEVDRVDREADAKRDADRSDRERKMVVSDAESTRVRHSDGQEMNGREWVDARIAEGFDRLVNTSSGAVPKWALANAQGQGYPIKKELLAYARHALEDVTPREQTDEEVADAEGIPVEDVRASDFLFARPDQHEEIANRHGQEAFARGDGRVYPKYLQTFPNEVRKAWYQGWDAANLAAPVPDAEAVRQAKMGKKPPQVEPNTNGPQDGVVASPVEAPQAGGPEATAEVSAASAGGAGVNPTDQATIDLLTRMAEAEDEGRLAPIDSGTLRVRMMIDEGLIVENKGSKSAAMWITSDKGRALLDKAGVQHAQTPKPSYGQSNKLFTSDAAEKARALLRAKRDQLNAGFDPEVAQAGLTLMGYHIEAGARAFIDAARAVAGDLGMTPAELRNNLRSWYTSARMWLEDNGGDVRGMDDDATVKVDLARIDQWGTKAPESAIAPQAEESNDADAKQAGTQPDDRNGDEGRRAGDVPRTESDREAARGADQPDRAGDAGLRADGGIGGAGDRAEADAGRADAGKRKGEAGRSGNRSQPGDRVPDGPKPERADRSVNYLAPVGSIRREGGWKATAERNLDIVELVNRLDAENRSATPDEQALLVKFTGWGAGEIRNNLLRTVARNAAGERRIVPPSYGEWKEMGERAASLLTGDALETALQSTQYAHYTSEQVIRSIWGGLRRLGFNGGKIVEPGMGTGLFAVAAPGDILGRSNYTGIELDGFTAKVAQYLLPQETVLPGDYTKTKLPDGFFDIAIGNPPFANIKVTDDPAYKKHRFSLHDYFFAKTIDKVRPGGLLVFVTSRYTMDKLDQKARQYIADRADLLAAIRLPQTAFKENAGTEVVTDVLFLQRRAPDAAPSGQAWLTSEPLRVGAEEVNVNSYYLAHPEMVLGKHATTGSMYRKNEYTVEPGSDDIESDFAKAIENLPQDVYIEAAPKAASEIAAKSIESDMRPAAEKEGGVYLKDGEVYRRDEGVGRPVASLPEKLGAKDIAWLKDYVPLRDAVKQAQRDQLRDGDWEASLKALNKAYDAFVKKHGLISTFTTSERTFTDEDGNENTVTYKRYANRKRLEVDIESPLVQALEKVDDEGKITKSPFLLGRTLKKPTRPEINSAADAVAVTLDEIGRFDLPYVSKLLGKSEAAVIAELGDEIYQHPDGTWIMADEYLSGDVVAKLDEANVAAKADSRFERNVEALVRVQPRPLAYSDITVKLGAGWIEAEVVEQFAREVLDENLTGIRYEQATGSWAVPDSSKRWGRTSTSEWATDDRSARELLDAVLNNRTIKITRTDKSDGKTTTWTDQEATALANERAKKMADRFKTWIWTDGPRTARLVDKYNRLFNNLAPRKFDGSHLTFPGLSTRYSLYDHQRRAIWRVIATGNTYLNHAVGAGKTLEMIVAGMEQRRLGLIRKPMYVVPNHMLNQFAREFLDAYPAANIMVADEQAFHTGNRRRFMAQAALNDPDAIVISHSSFGKIQTSQETRTKVVDRFIAELEEIMDELKGSDNRIARSKVEKQIEQIRRRFEGKASTEGKDQALTFEDMGVDFLFLDEAHEFRKLDFATNRTAVKGIDANGSQRSLDLYTKLLWLNEQRPGRAAVLASGTPITNTMAEIFTVMRYMDQSGLERDGLAAFDAWAAMFGEVVSGFEQNAAGGYEMVERFSKFVNVPEMMKRVRSFMDVLTSDQLGDIVKRPALRGGLPENVIAEASADLEQYMKGELLTRIETSRKWKPSKDEPGNPDPIINIITDGRLSAIDMRFVDKMAGNDPNSKLNLMIDKIIEKHREYSDVQYTDPATGKPLARKGATQIVFSAVGFGDMVAKSRGFDARAWIDKRLAEAGVPKDAIAWMSDQNSHAKKEATFKAMRNGEKRVLLGSPKNMGTGVNVQGRLKVLHYLSPPWYPSDVEQPHGRIIRQGNMNTEAEIYWYATKGTYDSTAWNMVSRKQRFIEQAMRGDDSIRSLEDISEANQYEMASALAAGDERVIELAGLSNDIERLTKLKAAHAEEQVALKWRMDALDRHITAKSGASARLAGAIEARGAANQPFAMVVDGVRYEKQGEAGQAMIDLTQRQVEAYTLGEKETEAEIARFQGTVPVIAAIGTDTFDGKPVKMFDVVVRAGPVDLPLLESKRSLETTDPTGLAQRVGNALNRLESEKRRAEEEVVQAKTELAQAKRKAGAPFEYEAELAEKIAERERLQSEMAAETEAAQKAADATKVQEEGVEFEATVAEPRDTEYGMGNEQAPASPRRDANDPVWGLEGAGAVSDRGNQSDRGVRRDGVPVVKGLGIAERFERHGATALVGESVSSAKELADLAQIYRDPRHETMRVFFTSGDKIVHATAVSTRSASSAPLLPGNLSADHLSRWITDTMRSSGADGYFLLHNHPTGIPKPSPEDIAVTKTVAMAAFGFRGHVVINSNKFGTIDWSGDAKVHDLPVRPDNLLKASKPNPILGEVLVDASHLARLAKDVQNRQGDYVTIILTSSGGLVRAVVDAPRSMIQRADIILLGALRKHMRLSGAYNVFLVGTSEDIDLPAVRKALAAGVLTAAINDKGQAVGADRRMPDFMRGGPARFVAEETVEYNAAEPLRFDDPETEQRFQAAKAGLDSPQTFRERAGEWMETAWHGISRHWIALPNLPKYADLQQKLRAIESAPQHARERTVEMLEDMVKDFTREDLDLFTRKVILDDLSWDAANDRDLPFGFTPETLLSEKAKVDRIVQADPDKKVWKAVMKRKVANRRIAQELVEAGVLEAEQIKNPAYYRHQVLEYARAQAQYARTPGKKLRTPKWAKRMGSTMDINANLLEAEFDWLNKAFIDIPVAKTIEWIKKSDHNILEDLRDEAKASNKSGVAEKLAEAQDVLEDVQSSDDEKMQAAVLIDQEKGFRQSIAMGFQHVRTALEDGLIDVPARFQSAAAAIEGGRGAVGDPPFSFLAWMLDNDQPGAMGAAMVLKAVGQRRVWTKNLLGKDYVDPNNADELVKRLAPEGYRTWQPDEGKLLFTVKTLPEHVIDTLLHKIDAPEGVDGGALRAALEGARSQLAMGGDRYTMILPEEVADTLSNLRRDEMDGLFEHMVLKPVRWWKRWVLINPRRFIKYNLNNLSGDFDALFAGNPGTLRHVGRAARELANVKLGKAKASERYNEAVARGVFDSGVSVQEIPDINKLSAFERFAEEPGKLNKVTMIPLRKAWNALQGVTQWRENVFRYAAYLDYVERIEAGESQASIGYGASVPKMVDAVTDHRDRAALLARDLLGDYGAISHYGGWLRQTVIPFWSWTEINTKRYWRLTGNAFSQGVGKGFAVGGGLAAAQGARMTAWLVIRMAALTALMSLWNNLFFPDEEEELSDFQKAQMHVILGRNKDGDIITLRMQGAFSDALSWFGLRDMAEAVRNHELGRGSPWDIALAAPKAAVNKIGTSLSPVISVPAEAGFGKKLWPDVFNARPLGDGWRNLFATVSLENEYDMALDKPSRGYGRSWQEAVIYRKDPGEIAYNDARGIAYDWLKRTKGQEFEGGITSDRSRANKEYHTALKFGDQDAADRALESMVKLGVDQGDYNAMIKRAAPLGPIAKKDRQVFLDQLTEKEYQTFVRAQAWYQETFLGAR